MIMTHLIHTGFRNRVGSGQSLPEYLLIATLLGGVGLAGVVGFNGGIGAVFNQLKANLVQGGSAPVANQTNQQIASAAVAAQQAATTPSVPISAPVVTAPSVTPPVQAPPPEPAAQLQSLGTLLTSMDPANLPEVSGSNSTVDITQVLSSANTLVQQANALEAAQKSNPGLNVSDLIFEARKVAAAQFFFASVLTEGPPPKDPVTWKAGIAGPNSAQGQALLNLIIAQKPNDPEAINFKVYYENADYATFKPGTSGQVAQIQGYSNDYKVAYQPLKSTITQLNIQTQQANTVVTNGGNINNNANVNGNANQTLQDANAINACQNATCN